MSQIIQIAISRERKIEASLETVPLTKLKLDPTNVRFKHLDKNLSQSEIEQLIWDEDDTRDLYREILTSRGLTDPPIVDAEYVVKEGNRRIVCLRRLSEEAHKHELKGISEDEFDSVQCIVLPLSMPQKDMDLYLAREHVSGKKQWAALNKARHIYDLHEVHKMNYDDIRDYLSIGKASVIRMVEAYKGTVAYGKKDPKDKDWVRKFTYFDELYKKPELKKWLSKNADNLDRFSQWVAEGKFPDHRSIRSLPEVLVDKDAVSKIESKSGSMAAAIAVLAEKDPSLTSESFRNIKVAIDTLRNIPRQEFIAAAHNGARLKMLKDLRNEAENLIKDIESIAKK